MRIETSPQRALRSFQVEAPNSTGAGAAMAGLSWIAALPGEYRLPLNSAPFDPNIGPLVKVGVINTTSIVYNPAAFPLAVAAEGENAVGGAALVPNCSANRRQHPLTHRSVCDRICWCAGRPVHGANHEQRRANLNTGVGPPAQLTGPSAPFMTTSTVSITASGFDAAIELSRVRRAVPCLGLAAAGRSGSLQSNQGLMSCFTTPDEYRSPVGLFTGAFAGKNLDSCAASAETVTMNNPATLPVASSFRPFYGFRTRAEADGGWLRRCSTLTGNSGVSVVGNQVTVQVEVDEDSRGGARGHPALEDLSMVLFTGDLATTP
ncbi:MAG: hypothetical protein IPO66_01955 [Rhodanobacteraceae bacterium]|nr:hypothetical protein [Rhodanobacteraceae bacterium]